MRLLSAAVAICVLLAGAPPTAASGEARPDRLAPADFFQMEYALDPRISPDGRTVVYTRRSGDIMSDRYHTNLWSVDFDGGNHRAVTTGHVRDSTPRWSPDGKRLAFLSDRDGALQVYMRWMDTGQVARLTNLATPPTSLAWSPDGKWLAITALAPDKPRTVAQLPAAPEGAEWAKPATVIDTLTYRWDGAGYLRPGYSHLYVLPADGGTPRQISSGDFQHGGVGFGAAEPVWSADGKSILLSVNRRPDHARNPLDSEIYAFPVGGGEIRALTDRRGPDSAPAVSPDGRRVAYLGFDDRFQGYQITRLYVMNSDGGERRVLTGDLDRSVDMAAWAPDGKSLFFTYDDEGNSKLASITLDGTMKVLTGDLGSGGWAYGGRGAFTVGAGGRLAFAVTRPDLPGDVAVLAPVGGPRRLVTRLNEDVLAHKTLGAVEEIRYPSSRDGREIHGWVIKPPDFVPGTRYPLILEIHGGPFANYGDRFDMEKQLFAAAGFVVLYVNPRGSTSYGEEFGNLIHHAYPGDDFYDLDAGVDAILEQGYVDPERLYVTGGSGGGVLTCWMIGRTDRFRAAASLYPVINWYSFVLTADASNFFVRYWFPGFPWEHTAHYMERSLLSVVGNVKTPTLVMTGEEDWRTPMSESEQYYLALKLLGVEAVLVRFPDEAHGIAGRPSHHMAKVLHILGWFDEHDAGGEGEETD